jgi:hypothetical protein
MSIEVRKPKSGELESLGVGSWPIWTCEPSRFEWSYDDRETCYILEGEVTVRAADEEISFGAGDLVIFPQGLDCVWEVRQAVRKHYRFG